MSRLPPGLVPIVIAAAGALALGVGAVATLDSNFWGIPLVAGGALLLAWSLSSSKRS